MPGFWSQPYARWWIQAFQRFPRRKTKTTGCATWQRKSSPRKPQTQRGRGRQAVRGRRIWWTESSRFIAYSSQRTTWYNWVDVTTWRASIRRKLFQSSISDESPWLLFARHQPRQLRQLILHGYNRPTKLWLQVLLPKIPNQPSPFPRIEVWTFKWRMARSLTWLREVKLLASTAGLSKAMKKKIRIVPYLRFEITTVFLYLTTETFKNLHFSKFAYTLISHKLFWSFGCHFAFQFDIQSNLNLWKS